MLKILSTRNQLTLCVRLLLVIISCLFLNSLFVPVAWAESLSERVSNYPHWQNLPTLSHYKGEINYPDWFIGTWQVKSVLTEQIAPFAPDIVTPGFEGNRRYLNQPVAFKVRFHNKTVIPDYNWSIPSLFNTSSIIIADRRYNAKEITRAYLGESGILEIKLVSKPTPKLISLFPEQRRLISTVIGYDQKLLENDHFLTTELTNQQFEKNTVRYLNQVETTTDYYQISPSEIEAQQMTAIYLSPQDPNYFSAQNQPIALYRYHLSLERF